MNFLDKIGLSKFWENLKSKFIESDTVRKIVIVDDYPEIEEEGVLYLKKETTTAEEETNLVSTGTQLNYRISGSGGTINSNVDYYSVVIPVEANTRYIITRTLITEHFRACLLAVEEVTASTAYSGLIENDTGLTIDITTAEDTKLLFINYYQAGDSYDHTSAYNDLKVIKYAS